MPYPIFWARSNNQISLDLLVDHISFSKTCLIQIRTKTVSSLPLSLVYCLIHQGWPLSHQHIPYLAQQYWGRHDELSTERNISFKENGIVIPLTLLESHLADVHEGYQVIFKGQQATRDTIYWFSIHGNIKEYITSCQVSIKPKGSLHVEPLLDNEVPQSPCQNIEADFFEWSGKCWLLFSD